MIRKEFFIVRGYYFYQFYFAAMKEAAVLAFCGPLATFSFSLKKDNYQTKASHGVLTDKFFK
jgi:hypothetical protein